MSEIDLVPVRYQRRRALRAWILRAGVVYLAVAAALFALWGVLGHEASRFDQEIEQMQVEQARVELAQNELSRLSQEQERLGQRLAVLEGLRGGIAAKDMFRVVDDSLAQNVWFRSWRFRRAGEIVQDQKKAVETGYFIVLPQEAEDEPRKTWRFHTHMEINAEAEDHSALAGFVRRLSQQHEIEQARILSTRVRERNEASVKYSPPWLR